VRGVVGEVFQLDGERARLSAWRADDGIGYLAPYGDPHPITERFARACAERLRIHGYRSVVTSALLDRDAAGLVAAGFSSHHDLHLLRHDLEELPPDRVTSRRARKRDQPGAVRVDAACFDDIWALDLPGLREVIEATPRRRFRVVDADDVVAAPHGSDHVGAYAVTGLAGVEGYLQRLAVHPDLGGRGVGRGLVADALRWLVRSGARRAYVNTQFGNEVALHLYRSTGFHVLPTGLRILGRTL
jgi:ribosomal protein S18 acetylase RimI-like enzyme